MSYSPQGSPSQERYPQSGKPVGGYGGEDPPQRGKSGHQKQQQQESAVRVLPQGHLPESNNPDKQSSHQNSHLIQQQQLAIASPVRVLPQGLPEINNPDKQSSHQSSHHHQQQQSIPLGVPSSSGYLQTDHYPESHSSLPGYPNSHIQTRQQRPVRVLSQGYNPKDNDLSIHQNPIQSHKQVIASIQDPSSQQTLPKDSSTTHRLPSERSSKTRQELNAGESSVEGHMDPSKCPNPTSSDFPVNDHGEKHLSQTKEKPILQPMPAKTNSKVDQQRNYHSLQDHTNGSQQRPNPRRDPLPVPEGYPPPGLPTSPSKLEPRPKKGLLEKICCCFF